MVYLFAILILAALCIGWGLLQYYNDGDNPRTGCRGACKEGEDAQGAKIVLENDIKEADRDISS